jgi:hypothetical protein
MQMLSYKDEITRFLLCFSVYFSNTFICFYLFQNQPSESLIDTYGNYTDELLIEETHTEHFIFW